MPAAAAGQWRARGRVSNWGCKSISDKSNRPIALMHQSSNFSSRITWDEGFYCCCLHGCSLKQEKSPQANEQTKENIGLGRINRVVGRSENSGVPVLFGGHNLPLLVEIGLHTALYRGGKLLVRIPHQFDRKKCQRVWAVLSWNLPKKLWFKILAKSPSLA